MMIEVINFLSSFKWKASINDYSNLNVLVPPALLRIYVHVPNSTKNWKVGNSKYNSRIQFFWCRWKNNKCPSNLSITDMCIVYIGFDLLNANVKLYMYELIVRILNKRTRVHLKWYLLRKISLKWTLKAQYSRISEKLFQGRFTFPDKSLFFESTLLRLDCICAFNKENVLINPAKYDMKKGKAKQNERKLMKTENTVATKQKWLLC